MVNVVIVVREKALVPSLDALGNQN